MTNGMHIAGKSLPGSGDEVTLVDPATGQPGVTFAQATADDVTAAVAAAHEAFGEWSTHRAGERARVLLQLADLLVRRCRRFALR